MRKLKNEELNRKSIQEFKASVKQPIIIVLDNIRSLHNVGSVFRTADAFLIESVYLCGITGTPPHREIQKSALGATESVDWKYFENTIDAIEKLKKDNVKVVAVEQTSTSISLIDFTLDLNERTALIFGHEIKGVDQDVINQCDYCIEIPQLGTKHSFNISVSVGIVLWDLLNK
ncbi:MAG: RNA methyltransferase [Bacteroidales bacterium]|nr:RNA methyltransferase [Bacteroidales bacterium]